MIDKNEPVYWKCTLSDGDHRRLFGLFGLRPVVIILSAALPEMMVRMYQLHDKYGYEILCVTKEMKGIQWSPVVKCWFSDPTTMINYLRMRQNRNNVVFFTIHSAVNWQSLDRLRQVVPDAKIISFVYDWQNLFVPREKLSVWDEYADSGSKYALAEADVIDKALEGRMCDAIIHGDYGDNWEYVCARPLPGGSYWIPRSQSKEIYQPMPSVEVENRCVFLATVLDKKRFAKTNVLFPETNIINVQRRVCDAGYKIDIFSLNPRPEVVEEYNKEFPHKMVRIHQGMPIRQLLPVLSGRYKYGMMLYEWETHVTDNHDAVTLPTKFFTYLALGVPVLASARLKSVCRFIRELGVGVIFEDGDTFKFKEKMATVDYAALRKNVEAVRFKFASEEFDERFCTVFKNVVELPKEQTVWWKIHNGTNSSGK